MMLVSNVPICTNTAETDERFASNLPHQNVHSLHSMPYLEPRTHSHVPTVPQAVHAIALLILLAHAA